jgi:galactitol-specific phosphotransferase system IIC component
MSPVDIVFGFLMGMVFGVLAGAELTVGLWRSAGKPKRPRGTVTPTGMLIATFLRLFGLSVDLLRRAWAILPFH